MKNEEWVVTVYEFNENTHQYQFRDTLTFKENEQLLQFIKDNAHDTTSIRYTISYVVETYSFNKHLAEKPLPKCDHCGSKMKVASVREDGCRYFECPECGATTGEETEEWFRKQREADVEMVEKTETNK